MARIRGFSQTTYDVIADSRYKQRDIGTLINNQNSLVIKGTLTKANTVDYFKFTVKGNLTNVGMITKATGKEKQPGGAKQELSSVDKDNKYNVGYSRVQLMDSHGNIIADSSDGATTAQKKAYQELRAKTLDLKAGSYSIKVTRAPGILNTQKVMYAVQMVAGAYTAEYTTKQLDASADVMSELVKGNTALAIIDASETTSSYSPVSTGTLFDYLS